MVPKFSLPHWTSAVSQQLSQYLVAEMSLGSVVCEFLLPLKTLSQQGGAKGCQEESWGQGCQLTFHFHSLITRLIKPLGLCPVEGVHTVDNSVCQGLCLVMDDRATGQGQQPDDSPIGELLLQTGSVRPFLLTAPGTSMPCSECDFHTGLWLDCTF